VKSYLRYLALYFSLALCLLLCVAYVFDPLGYFRNKGVKLVYIPKNRVWDDNGFPIEIKPSEESLKTIIAGSSRVKRGFSVADPEMRKFTGATYNLGIAGVQFNELNRYINFMLPKYPIETLVVCLDLNQFGAKNKETLSRIPTFVRRAEIFSLLRSAFGIIKNVFDDSANKALATQEVKLRTQKFGHKFLTQSLEASMYARFLTIDWQPYEEHLEILNSLLTTACKDNIETKLFISPTHVRQLILLKMSKNLPRFLQWKKDLARISDAQIKAGCKVSLTDFSQISKVTSEKFPEKNDKNHEMRWYWESSHYKSELGLFIIKRLWNDASALPKFGNNLTIENVELENSKTLSDLEKYMQKNPEVFEEISRYDLRHVTPSD
jgi:hypothetical protein